MILTVVFYIFILFAGIQVSYYLLFSNILFSKKKNIRLPDFPISVIIFAKNNAENLSNFLPSILTQKYKNFEVVLIDNNSTDRTQKVINSFAKIHSNIHIVNVENNEAFWGSKKYAMTLGIKVAKHEHLLFTEANSRPISEHWISEMSMEFSNEKTIVLGYSSFEKQKNIANFLIRFYHFLTAIQFLNFTKLGMPFMADGKNLAYKKEDFYRAKGFINHMKQDLGEDDLFIQDASNEINTTYCISKNSFVETANFSTLSDWFFLQRKKFFLRKKYKLKHRFLLSLFTFSKLFFYVFGIVLFFFYPYKIILSFMLGYFLVQYIIVGISAKRLDEKNLIYFLPFLDISFLLIKMSIFMANLTSKPPHWK